jgi:hypothetical protein
LQCYVATRDGLRVSSGPQHHAFCDFDGSHLFVFPQIYCSVRFDNAGSTGAATDLRTVVERSHVCPRLERLRRHFDVRANVEVFGVSVVGLLYTSGLCLRLPPAAGSNLGSSLKVSGNLFSVHLNGFVSGSWAFMVIVHCAVAVRGNCSLRCCRSW